MLIRLLLWAFLIGSVVMGYFGFKTGSATNAALGMVLFLVGGFVLYFLLKAFLHFGFFMIKVFLILGLIALIAVAGLKGCEYMVSPNKASTPQEGKEQSRPIADSDNTVLKKAFDFLSFKGKQKSVMAIPKNVPTSVNPTVLPSTIQGTVTEVRSGYLFKIGTHFVKLYGIDAPDPTQNCLDKRGATYKCGRKSKKMLERLILGRKITCQVAGGDYGGNYIATCKTRGVDVGASLLRAGWAVADRAVTTVYTPYEDEAHLKKEGLWAGKFVAPWTARAKHVRQLQVKKEAQKGFWERLFQ